MEGCEETLIYRLTDWDRFYCIWYNWTGGVLASSQIWKTDLFSKCGLLCLSFR